MSVTRMTIDGYGQVEINNCAFRRDGRIEAQCAPDTVDFATIKVENGMLLNVDNVARKVSLPTDSTLPIALTYSAEHLYDERALGLKNFALNGSDDFYPRLGYLAVGDKYTTNCIGWDSSVDTAWANESAFISALESYAAVPLYAGIAADGCHLISAAAPTIGPVLRVIEYTTMPDSQPAVKLQVYSC